MSNKNMIHYVLFLKIITLLLFFLSNYSIATPLNNPKDIEQKISHFIEYNHLNFKRTQQKTLIKGLGHLSLALIKKDLSTHNMIFFLV